MEAGCMKSGWTWATVLVVALAVALAGGGCKKKGPKPGEGIGDGSGLGEEGLAGGSSLERAKRGLSPEEGGPLGDVHFDYDSADVDSSARDVLARNAQWLKQNSRAKVELEGHADSRGTIEYNLGLSAKRAKAVKDQLIAQGIAAERLSTISYGKELPLCQEETEACWARNRRVHAVVLGQ
jgi:peptidoglycan-associated lipoprotein